MLKLRDGINWILDVFTGICFVLMFLTVVYQIFARSLSSIPCPWTDELARFLYIWIVFIGAIVTTNNDEHIRVEVIYNAIPARWRRWLTVLHNLIAITFCLAAAYGGIILMEVNWDAPFATLPSYITYAAMYVTIPISMIAMSLIMLAKSVLLIRDGISGAPAQAGAK